VLERMRVRLAGWPWQAEVAAVVVLAFGLAIANSLLMAFHPATVPPITQRHLLGLLVLEPLFAMSAIGFLLLRRWPFAHIDLRPTPLRTAEGIGLLAVTWLLCAIAYSGVQALFHIDPVLAGHHFVANGIAPWTAVAASIVNALYEEFFVTGYLVTTLKDRGHPWAAINLSAAIRLVYHLYQGEQALVSILPLGLVFAFWYARGGRLWPLVVAHAVLDLIALYPAVH